MWFFLPFSLIRSFFLSLWRCIKSLRFPLNLGGPYEYILHNLAPLDIGIKLLLAFHMPCFTYFWMMCGIKFPFSLSCRRCISNLQICMESLNKVEGYCLFILYIFNSDLIGASTNEPDALIGIYSSKSMTWSQG